MMYDLSVLRKSSVEALTNSAASELSEVEDTVIRLYKEVVSTNEEVTTETSLTDMTDEEYGKFMDLVCAEYNITYNSENDRFANIAQVVEYVVNETEASAENLFSWDSHEFQEVQKRIDVALEMLEGYGVSEEGIGTGLLKVFVGVADLFIRVGNTFKTNLFKFYKDLKRSEIRYFYESHLLMCKTVEGRPYQDFMNEQISVPTGMISPYKKAIDYIDSVYGVLDLNAYAKALYDNLVDIRRQMTRGEVAYKRGFTATAQSATMLTNTLRNIVAKQTQVFTDKTQSGTKQFKTVFGSMADFKDARVKLIDMEEYLQNTKSLIDQIDITDTIIGDITSYLTEDEEVDKKFIEQLAVTIKFLATAFDVYGTCAMRQMALEHNLILVYEQLYKKI